MGKNTGKDWVLVDWETARVRCPWHGLLDPAQDYIAGLAVCGCMFVAAPGGLLRACKDDDSLRLVQHDVRADVAKDG